MILCVEGIFFFLRPGAYTCIVGDRACGKLQRRGGIVRRTSDDLFKHCPISISIRHYRRTIASWERATYIRYVNRSDNEVHNVEYLHPGILW